MRIDRSIGFTVKALSNQIQRAMEELKAQQPQEENVTGMQGGFLSYIGDHSPTQDVFQRDVEAEFNVRRSTASGILSRLEEGGYIVRQNVTEDARLKRLRLTERGQRFYAQAISNIENLERQIALGLSDEELAQFFRIAGVFFDNLRQFEAERVIDID